MPHKHLAIVIPVYHEGKIIAKVINSLPKRLPGISKISILVVNDGSTDNSAEQIKKTRATLISHCVNLGYGGASCTGLEAAKKISADVAVTFDGDGQHDPADIEKIIKPVILDEADLVIGNRFADSHGMPLIKKVGIRGLNFIIFCFSGHWASDSQCGLKAFSKKALDKIHLNTAGMEFASEVILEAKKSRLRITEVPAKTIYTKYSISKGQNALNGINILVKLLIHQLTN